MTTQTIPDENPELTILRNIIVGRLLTLKPGDLISHHELERLIQNCGLPTVSNIRRPDDAYYTLMRNKVRAKLQTEIGVTLVPVHGQGYELATVSKTLVDIPRDRERRAGRQIWKAQKAVTSLKDGDLDDYQRRSKAAVVTNLRHKRAEVRRDAKIAETLAAATPTLPRAGRIPRKTAAAQETPPAASVAGPDDPKDPTAGQEPGTPQTPSTGKG